MPNKPPRKTNFFFYEGPSILLLSSSPFSLPGTGGAIAYAVSMCGMYLVFARIARNELMQLKANRKTP
jgi:hypothetical protein